MFADRFGNPEGAYHFNASEENYLRIDDHPDLQIPTNLTISVWIKHSAFAGVYEDIVMKGNISYGIQFNDTSDQVLFHLYQPGNNWRNLNSNYTPIDGQWFDITGTYDGAVQRVYIDGVEANSNTWYGTIHTDSSPLDCGGSVAGNNAWYDGDMDDLRIYHRVLSASEVMQLYHDNGFCLNSPQNVQITCLEDSVSVSWQAVSGANSYRQNTILLPLFAVYELLMWPFSIKKGRLTRIILTKLQNLLCSLRSGEIYVISELTREKDIAVTEIF